MRIVWLTGDYTGKNRERQQQAAKEKCDIVIEFHFNASANPDASGTEVWHRQFSLPSFRLAKSLHDRIVSLGFKPRGVKSAVPTSRASFINSYPRTSIVVLLEPCFVTNRLDAQKLHQDGFMAQLAEAIASAVKDFIAKENRKVQVIGLSIGHKGKTSNKSDRGARCLFGDFEADHASELAKLVAERLQPQKPDVAFLANSLRKEVSGEWHEGNAPRKGRALN